jgi:hypothetical protein
VRREFSSAVRNNALLRAKDRCETCGSRQQLELHHVGHRRDASLFNCLVLCALPSSRARASSQCAPGLGKMTAGLTLSSPKCAAPAIVSACS